MVAKINSKMAESYKTVMGSLWKVFNEKDVWEILIDAYDEVYYVKKGEFLSANKILKNKTELDQLVKRLLAFSKKKFSEEELSHFFNLDSFTRVAIVLPPLAVKGPSVIIRKIPAEDITLDDLVKWKALDLEGKVIIQNILKGNKGFLVSGNMGSGKTTLLNTLINAIPLPSRIVTLEREPHLIISRARVCRMQPQTLKAEEMINLISISERMRPDYLILSESVGPEVMPFMDTVRNNCVGVMLTTGENILDSIKRIETKAVLSSDGQTLEEVRYVIAQSFKHLIFQEKLPDGSRRVSSINELEYVSGELKLKTIYKS